MDNDYLALVPINKQLAKWSRVDYFSTSSHPINQTTKVLNTLKDFCFQQPAACFCQALVAALQRCAQGLMLAGIQCWHCKLDNWQACNDRH